MISARVSGTPNRTVVSRVKERGVYCGRGGRFGARREFAKAQRYASGLAGSRGCIEASHALTESEIGLRQAARMLGTSPTQIYRLLDTTVPGKPVGQLLALLALLDRKVEVSVRRAG